MLPTALQCGVKVLDYWFMTYGEILDTINAYKENDKNRIRETASFNYSLANLIGLSVARLMDKDAEYPSISAAFPTLFDDLEENKNLILDANGDRIPEQQDWEIAKARLMQYAEVNNEKER